MVDVTPDPVRLVGAVDQVFRPAEIEGEGAERVVRPRRNRGGQIGILGMDRGRRTPGRVRRRGARRRRNPRRWRGRSTQPRPADHWRGRGRRRSRTRSAPGSPGRRRRAAHPPRPPLGSTVRSAGGSAGTRPPRGRRRWASTAGRPAWSLIRQSWTKVSRRRSSPLRHRAGGRFSPMAPTWSVHTFARRRVRN